MSEKTLNTRIQHKHDTEANWKKATSFVPKAGEIIIYDKDNTYSYQRIKIGDGTRTVTALPFVTTSVNGNTGDVRITASSIGAADVNEVENLKDDVTLASAYAIKTLINGSDYNNLLNRPCYEEITGTSYTIKNDPIVGMTSIFDGEQIPLRQIPDIPSSVLSQPLSMIISMNSNGEIQEIPFTSDVTHGEELPGLEIYYHTSSILEEIPFIFIKTTGALPEAGIPHAGTFYIDILFLYIINMSPTADSSLTINFPNEITIPGKQLDDALIPDNIARLDDIPNFEAPVQSVNGKTGEVVLNAADVGALPSTTVIPDALADLTADSTHRTVTDAEKATWNAKSNFSGNYNDLTNKPTIPSIAGLATETYVNNAVSGKVDKVSGKGLSTNDYTTAEKNKLAGIAEGAEVNQNAFAKVTVGSTTIAADTESDTLTLVAGSNVTITPDATNDKITIAATDTTYSAASQSAAGLMSADDKKKLDGIATGANKITVDSALSTTSTNPVQNKIVNAAISNLNTLVGNTAVATQISTAISNLINGAPTTLDTLGEIATAMAANEDVVEALEAAIGTKANASDLTSHTGNKNNPHEVTLAQLGVTATAAELNKMDGVTATTAELNFVNGVTSSIQTQLNTKVPTSCTINGKTLSSDITLSASDVGAMSAKNPVGTGSFSMGRKIDSVVGNSSHAEGLSTTASGLTSHAEGNSTTASNTASHAEGFNTEASGTTSHAEGMTTIASGSCSHTEGSETTASGECSHAEGYRTEARSAYQHVQGRCNIVDTEGKYAHIVGAGIYNAERNGWSHSNAHTLDWDGNAWFSGDVYVGSTSGTNRDDGSKKLATEELVATKADLSEGAIFIQGSGATDSTAKTSTWVGTSDKITSYYDGLTIRYKIGVAGQSTTTLNINGLGAKTVYRFSDSKLTTHFPVNSIIHLIYHADLNSGCWMCSDYDANTNTYQRVYSSTNNVEYPITTRYNTTTGSSYYAEYGRYSTGVTLNPSTNTITATTFKGNLTGTATKATQDASGNVITSTYATKAEVNSLTQAITIAEIDAICGT